jgi:hypothetical protein
VNIRNYIIGVLAVTILFLGSIVYKQQNAMFCHHFPIPGNLKNKSNEPPFYLFLFFSKKDCLACLLKTIEVINTLPSQFYTVGVVPDEELKDEKELKRLTGGSFPLYGYEKYKKYLPWHTPTLFGISPAGKIIFVLPAVEGQEASLGSTIRAIYGNLYSYLEKENIPRDDN